MDAMSSVSDSEEFWECESSNDTYLFGRPASVASNAPAGSEQELHVGNDILSQLSDAQPASAHRTFKLPKRRHHNEAIATHSEALRTSSFNEGDAPSILEQRRSPQQGHMRTRDEAIGYSYDPGKNSDHSTALSQNVPLSDVDFNVPGSYLFDTGPTVLESGQGVDRAEGSTVEGADDPSKPRYLSQQAQSWVHIRDQILQTPTPSRSTMNTTNNDDLFLREAHNSGTSRINRLLNRSSLSKRQSVPHVDVRSFTSMEHRRPRTSGGLNDGRPASRSGIADSVFEGARTRDTVNLSGVDTRPRRGSSRYALLDRQPRSPRSPQSNDNLRSPELTMYGRLRPFSSAASASVVQRSSSHLLNNVQESEGSAAENSEQKQSFPDSASVDSQTAASTVWDELDDLKSRIKKLELTGKVPTNSMSATEVSPQLERPRTATTAPTTIDSSPKRDKKIDGESQSEDTQPTVNVPDAATAATGTPTPATLEMTHPLLHAALTKAKTLLNTSLYRSLEATASDAHQLLALSVGSADRQLKRRADTMCRNLTDLCLALCDGKHETAPLPNHDFAVSPVRHSRAASRMDDTRSVVGRSVSRLDARRSSILGAGALSSPLTATSPRYEADDSMSVSGIDTSSEYLDRRRHARSSSRFSSTRMNRYDLATEEEEPSIRPISRNGSEFGFRTKQGMSTRGYQHQPQPQRSFSLREALAERRGSASGLGTPREVTRVASVASDAGRRWTRESTPPVAEEELSDTQRPVQPAPKQRLGSFNNLRPARLTALTPLRSSSISSHRTQQESIE